MSKGISHPSRQKPIKKVECSTATRSISNHSMSNHKHSTRKNKKASTGVINHAPTPFEIRQRVRTGLFASTVLKCVLRSHLANIVG